MVARRKERREENNGGQGVPYLSSWVLYHTIEHGLAAGTIQVGHSCPCKGMQVFSRKRMTKALI